MAVTERRGALDDRRRSHQGGLPHPRADEPRQARSSTSTAPTPARSRAPVHRRRSREYYEQHNANLYRAVYELAEEATAMFEGARTKLANFVGAPDPAGLVFTRGTTESINLIANAWGRSFLREGDEILFSEMEHHSNIVPWQLVAEATGAVTRMIPIEDDGTLDLPRGSRACSPIGPRSWRSPVSRTCSGTLPADQAADRRRRTPSGRSWSSTGRSSSRTTRWTSPSSTSTSSRSRGHKMLGPTASGGLYGRLELLDAMDPFLGRRGDDRGGLSRPLDLERGRRTSSRPGR